MDLDKANQIEAELIDDDTVVSEASSDVVDNKKPKLIDIVGAELQHLALIGISLKQKIAAAKTNPKKTLYKKKLEKNSKRAVELILYLERLQIGQAVKENQKQQEFINIKDTDDATTRGRISSESEQEQS